MRMIAAETEVLQRVPAVFRTEKIFTPWVCKGEQLTSQSKREINILYK